MLTMEINNLIIDEDLIGYLSSKENINTFINFCIRERQSVEIKMSMKRVRTPSIAELEKRHIASDTLKPLSVDEVDNPNTPFCGKKIVITGQFDAFPKRDVLGKLLRLYGADINTAISKHTNIVIMGNAAGPKKKEKIKDLQGQGFPIEVFNEFQLLKTFDEYNIPYEKPNEDDFVILE